MLLAGSALGLLTLPISLYDDSLLMVGARLVGNGKLPYIDFYTHYGPLGYTILSALTRLLGHPGLALRVGQFAFLTGIAVLLHWLFRSLQPRTRLGEYFVGPVVLAFSQVGMWPAFFGFAFAAASLLFFTLARSASKILPACLLAAAAGTALGATAMTRPGFGIYVAGALLVLEASAGRPQFGALRSPLLAIGLLFGAAASTALLLWVLVYPEISPALAFDAAILLPARLMSSGARHLRPYFLRDGAILEAIATGSALVAVTVAWAFAVARLRLRRLAAIGIAAGGILPFWLVISADPARNAGRLALTLLALAGLVVFAGRREVKQSALLRASATFGLAAGAFGHYFWARADPPHLVPFLTLALVGGALLMTSVRVLARVVLAGVLLIAYAPALSPSSFPMARLFKRQIVTHLLPWRCTLFQADGVEAVALADRLAGPGSRFVAVGSTQAWSSGDPAVVFLISSRLPYTRWFQYDPGLQTSPAVQQEMMRELEASGSQTAVVWWAPSFRWAGEDNRLPRTPFDHFFDRLYPTTVARFGGYEVRVRADDIGRPSPSHD